MAKNFHKNFELPGYFAIHYSDERPSIASILLWTLWGVLLAAIVARMDHAVFPAVAFFFVGVFMGVYGIRCVFVAASIVHDCAERWWHDEELERAQFEDMLAAGDMADDLEDEEPDLDALFESPIQRRWLQTQGFTAIFATPLLMSSTWGIGLGALYGASLPVEIDGLPAYQGILIGMLTGWLTFAWLTALVVALPLPIRWMAWTWRQRLLLLISPLLSLAALAEAAVLWIRWSLRRRPAVE